jgi:hypothetical protein
MTRKHIALSAALFTALFVALSAPGAARAQESADPGYRVDVLLPSMGLGWFDAPAADYERGIFVISAEVRVVERHGHGALVRVADGSTIWGGAMAVDADYVYRARLAGNDRLGLGLDVQTGLTVADFSHNEGTLPAGLAVGGNAGVSLDFRAYGFVVSLAGEYRLLAPQETALNGGPTGAEHALTATLGLGFGFWGA